MNSTQAQKKKRRKGPYLKTWLTTLTAVLRATISNRFWVRLRFPQMKDKGSRLRTKASAHIYWTNKLQILKKSCKIFLVMLKMNLSRVVRLRKNRKKPPRCWQKKLWAISSLRVPFLLRTLFSFLFRLVTWTSSTMCIYWRTRNVNFLRGRVAQRVDKRHLKRSSQLLLALVFLRLLSEALQDNQ